MIIDIVVQGDLDTVPAQYTFQYDDVFATSVSNTKRLLSKGYRININQTILLLADMVANLARDGHNREYIQQRVGSLIRPEQVMIGVPEMTRHLEFKLGTDYTIIICRPILYNNKKS